MPTLRHHPVIRTWAGEVSLDLQSAGHALLASDRREGASPVVAGAELAHVWYILYMHSGNNMANGRRMENGVPPAWEE